MGCDDYYDPRRDQEDRRYYQHLQVLKDLEYTVMPLSDSGSLTTDYLALCHQCGATVYCGNLRRVERLRWVYQHHGWHESMRRVLQAAIDQAAKA